MELTQKQIDVLGQNLRRKHIRIELLNHDLKTVDSIEGTVINGSITANASNDIRRSGNLTIAIPINLAGATLFDKLDGFVIHAGGKIWLDRYLKIFVGITDGTSQEENIIWYKLGVFLINNPTRTFGSNEFTISFECVDLMAKLTGKRQGQLTGQTTIIEQGHYEDDGYGNQIYIKTLLADTLSAVISELGGFSKYIINPIPDTYKYLPYEIKVGVGSTVYDILKQLMDVIPTWQMYFDLDGVFIVDPIPSGEDSIVYDVDEEQYISDIENYNFENVKNQVVVYGRLNTLTYYTENTDEDTNVEYSGNTLILKYDSLNVDNFTIGGTTFGFFTPNTFNTSAINRVQIYNAGQLLLTSTLVKFENSTKSFGQETGTTNIDIGTIPPKEICFIRIYNASLTNDNVVDITQPITFEFMGKQAVSYDMVDDNLESPFYINRNLDEPNYYAGLADTTIGLNLGEGYTLTLNNTSELTSLVNGTIITFQANYTNSYASGKNYTSITVNDKNGTQLADGLKLVQNSWNYQGNNRYRPNLDMAKLTNDYTVWEIRYEELDLDEDGVIETRQFVLIGRNPNVITSILSGGEYDNIYADQLAYERCLYELFMASNMNDAISLSVVPNYVIDVNCKIKYNINNALPRSIVNEDYDEVQYFITKQITYPLGIDSTPQNISAIRVYKEEYVVVDDNRYEINVTTIKYNNADDESKNELIIDVRTKNGCTLSFNNETQTLIGRVDSFGNAEIQTVKFSFDPNDDEITDNLVVIGDFEQVNFKTIAVGPQAYKVIGKINSIVQFQNKPKYTMMYQFSTSDGIDFDINVPENYESIFSNSFYSARYSLGEGRFPGVLTFDSNIKTIQSVGYQIASHRFLDGTPMIKYFFQNAVFDNTLCYINNIPVATMYGDTVSDTPESSSTTVQYFNYYVRNGTTRMAEGLFTRATDDSSLSSATLGQTHISSITFNNDGALEKISKYCCVGCTGLTSITIPSSVYEIGIAAFYNCENITTARFNQPSGMAITLPTAGSGSGMFYNKIARNMNIYTDNQTIHDYNYSADNVTPTFYHLDGTLWG